MKIIRIRRGFTTNSSGANEYVGGPGSSSGSASRAKPGLGTAQFLPVQGGSSLSSAGGATSASTVATPASASPANPSLGSAATLGLLGAAVLALFAVERGVRALLARRKPRDPPPPGA
jgi:hypothetical protein